MRLCKFYYIEYKVLFCPNRVRECMSFREAVKRDWTDARTKIDKSNKLTILIGMTII